MPVSQNATPSSRFSIFVAMKAQLFLVRLPLLMVIKTLLKFKQHATKATLALLFLCLCGLSSLQAQTAYVNTYKPVADSLSGVYGIPSSIILAIAIVESGAGTSRNSKLLNNHFGIVGKNNLLKTKGIKTRYKQYNSVLGSYVDFCKLLSRRKYYARLKGNNDYKLWIDAISKAGYSEAPVEWRKRITSTIQKYKLAGSK
ncbi:glucosaminidase domain-containing protein [Terrimonas rubra]|uniref:Glucosaminidase domain-containing protein n=1 Tax=Terrimonas rubra TaxID=1035890 RepID=A0ABW6A0M9_9BACT